MKYVWKVKILCPRVCPLIEMACFNMASQRSKVQLAPPTGNTYGIYDGRADTEIGY